MARSKAKTTTSEIINQEPIELTTPSAPIQDAEILAIQPAPSPEIANVTTPSPVIIIAEQATAQPQQPQADEGSYAREESAEESRIKVPNPFAFRTDKGVGAVLQEDRTHRKMQIRFDNKPSDEVRATLRDAGFRWKAERAAWEIQVESDQSWVARAAADDTFKAVTDMIRKERGMTSELS